MHMKKHSYTTAITIGILLLVTVIAVLFIRSRRAAAPSTQTVQVDQFSGIEPVSTNRVSIQNYACSPQVAKVTRGESIIWTNSDMVTHSITSTGSLPGLQSNSLKSGASYSYVFDNPGEYVYQCGDYANVYGKIIVVE